MVLAVRVEKKIGESKVEKDMTKTTGEQNIADLLKNWMMAALTLIFIFLYAAALFGWLKPLTDITMIARLEPIIFVIIGYYFGRLPAQQNEKTLRDEIKRQEQRADTVQRAKEQISLERETLEEKLKNVKTALKVSSLHASSVKNLNSEKTNSNELNLAVDAALRIIDS